MSTRSRRITLLGSRALPVRKADNLTAICEPTVLTVWDYHLTTLLASTACYGDSFFFTVHLSPLKTVDSIRSSALQFWNFTFCQQSIFVCFVWFSQWTTWRRNVFPVKYEINLYILFRRNSVLKRLIHYNMRYWIGGSELWFLKESCHYRIYF
jgi:hypothetical protein